MDLGEGWFKWLTSNQQGKTRLDVDLPAADQPGAGSFKTNKTAEDRVFTKDKLSQY